MMKFNSLFELLKGTNNFDDNEWVYTNLDIWRITPELAKFWIVSDEEVDSMADEDVYQSKSGPFLPISLKKEQLSPWMTIGSINGVVINFKREVLPENIILFVNAINYYREYDDFSET